MRYRLRGWTRRDFLQWSAASTLVAAGFGCGSSSRTQDEGPAPLVSKTSRSLHLVCPNGVFAWFQLLWPHVEVALANEFGFGGLAYHESAADGTHVVANPTTDDREWFASSQAPWIDASGNPYPGMEVTAFMAGRDETHTQFPTTAAVISGQASLVAGAAAIQVQESSALLPVIGVDPVLYGAAPGAPAISTAPHAQGLIDLFNSAAGSTVLGIDMADLVMFGIDGVANAPDSMLSAAQRDGLLEFGHRMIVSTKAMALGLTDCAVIAVTSGPLSDTSWVDPHQTFNTSTQFLRAINTLGRIGAILEGCYQYLSGVPDPRNTGRPMIDNVVLTVHGDTPHTPLLSTDWPDATPDECNWIYVVGKGYLKHGWFGRVHRNLVDGFQTSGFDGASAIDIPGEPSSTTSTVAGGAIAYAIAKGDSNFVSSALGAPLASYEGLIRSAGH